MLKHKLLHKSPKLQTELSLDDVMSSDFMQEHILNVEIDSINPEIFDFGNETMDNYLKFETDKLAALQSHRKLFSTDRGTVVHDPDKAIDRPHTVTTDNPTQTSRRTETPNTQTGTVKQPTPSTKIPYDKLIASKYTLNKLKFLNYTPKDTNQNKEIVEITIDDTDSDSELKINVPLAKQLKPGCLSSSKVESLTDVVMPVLPQSLISSSTSTNQIHAPVPQHAVTYTSGLQIPLLNLTGQPTSLSTTQLMHPWILAEKLQPTAVLAPPLHITLQNATNITWEPNKNYVVLVPLKNQITPVNNTSVFTGNSAGAQHQQDQQHQ